ncbi:hypothetical protein W02_03530 [Nitrospira sp. KM1]|uniref:hypothetical protein n=1 Tax=Nitrospira sp. KM1 TaxID=1936990 RepID=UPI0013A7B031|nr:hypothetical protein [Nitrospira sp. KM1]BCA53213.1 hypothetical protein W02_03530 [Nitrospira sp. KM1]
MDRFTNSYDCAAFRYVAMFQVMIVSLAISVMWVETGFALPKKESIYNECACACDGPTGGAIIDIRNVGGFACAAYNGKTCNYEDPASGGIRSGTTRWCTAYKPSGIKAAAAPLQNGPVMRRGVEDAPSAEPGPGPYGPTDSSAEAK